MREALLKARGPTATEEAPVDDALYIKLPKGNTIKPGTESADVALLRERLKVPAEEGAKDNLLDEKPAQALNDHQAQERLKATGSLTPASSDRTQSRGRAQART